LTNHSNKLDVQTILEKKHVPNCPSRTKIKYEIEETFTIRIDKTTLVKHKAKINKQTREHEELHNNRD
jgi:hypothetical protein